jgi:hypothetical protein
MSETIVSDVERGGRSGKGSVSTISVAVLNFDPSLGCDSTTPSQPCSDRARRHVSSHTFKFYHFPSIH